MFNRRDFLKSSTLVALAPTVPSFLTSAARAAPSQRDGRVLVVIELKGGNDGINTIVPYADPGYAKNRQSLRLPTAQLIKVNDHVGLHPALRGAEKLLESHRLAIVQGVGYPNPNRSHEHSMTIWQTARLSPEKQDLGWLGSALDASDPPTDGSPGAVLSGLDALPRALWGQRSRAATMSGFEDLCVSGSLNPRRAIAEPGTGSDLKAFMCRSFLDAYASADRLKEVARAKDPGGVYPETQLGERLRLIAQLLKGGFHTRVFYAIQAGYDNHYGQAAIHAQLLGELGNALGAFLDDLAAANLAERVLVLCFSEFGRTVQQNGSAGTDHGTAGPVLLAGPCVKAGLVGTTPSLEDLDQQGELKVGIDFRQVYATVLEEWLELPSKTALAGDFKCLPLFQK
jgi:uncharacterized protein (DUF1501 family)